MMADDGVYRLLAQKLNDMPHGFPAADGLEIQLLQWAFTPEEAAIALDVSMIPENAEAVAERWGQPVAETTAILDKMVKQGQISAFKLGGEFKYVFMPLLPGLQEGQLYRQDRTPEQKKEFVHLWEEYLPHYSKNSSYAPAIARVVPVSVGVKSEAKAHRLEDVHQMVDDAKSVWLMSCICREERGYVNKRCAHSAEVCLVMNAEEDTFEKLPQVGRSITKDEAHRILEKTEAEGLVHQTWNADSPAMYFICNCCPCCCALLRPMLEFGQAHAATSNFFARVDMDHCVCCGDCLSGCVVQAISEGDGVFSVDETRCLGCGVCLVCCQVDAIKLVRKPDAEQSVPLAPFEWAVQRAMNRPKDL